MPTNNKGVNMAVGEFAKPIYNLLDELGGADASSAFVLEALIKFLSGDQVKEFVSDFRRNHEMNYDEDDERVDDIVEKQYVTDDDIESLADWAHTVSREEDAKTIASYFSSLIPEC